jgi:hypothetical protein
MFAEMFGQFRRLRRAEFELDETRYEQLGREIGRWQEHTIELAQRQELRRDRGLERGPDL